MANALEDYLPILEKWFGDEMSNLHGRLPDKGNGILLGCPLWGEKYVERFGLYCLPTILAPKNLAALRGNCRMVLFTDAPSFANLWNLLRGFEAVTGIEIVLREIPPAVMARVGNQPKGDPVDNKYWVLGVAGQLALQMAGRAGMGFHMLMPDHVYGHEYFPNLQRLAQDYEGIAQPGISADVAKAHAALYAFRQPDGSLAVPDRDLGDIGWRFLHPQTRASLIADDTIPDNLPMLHLWTWKGKDRLYLSCCHMNATYLSPRMCAMAPSRIPATLDAELPSFFPEKFYVPKADDGLTYIELSDGGKPAGDQRGDLDAFVACCSEKVRYSDAWTPFAQRLYEVPIHEQETYTDEATVREQHAWLLAQLRDDKPTPKAKAAYRLIESLAYKVRA